MSITSIFLAGTSGIVAAQTQIRVAGDNIANINTPGYARKIANQSSVVVDGVGLGARITSVTRAADLFLQKASLTASARSGQTGVISDFLDQAQSLFGDPSEDSSFFSGLDDIYAAFSTASESPSSSLGRNAAIGTITDFLSDASRIQSGLASLAVETDRQVTGKVSRVNEILSQLAQTNVDISRSTVMGGDSSGSENIQSKLLDELSGLMSIQVSGRASGGITVRSTDGMQLVGDGGPSTITYAKVQGVGVLTATPPHGTAQSVIAGGGEIDGLLQLGKTELPKMAEQLSEFVTQAVDELNRVHNANTAVPAPTSLTGKATALTLDEALSGFTGNTRVAVTTPAGALSSYVDIDFDTGTVLLNGAASGTFTDGASFLSALDTALGPGSASFSTAGALSLTSGGANGLVISDDPAQPASKTGKGFSHYFGLNDLITSTAQTGYDTGLTGTSDHGFLPGEVISLQLTDSSGNLLRGVNVTVPTPGTGEMNELLGALNTGVGLFGSFGLDSNGRLGFTPAANQDVQVSVASDNTHRGAGGPSISEFFGIGRDVKIDRTQSFSIRQDISLNYNKLGFAQYDRAAGLNATAITTGDGKGALALAKAGSSVTSFGAAGDMRAVQMSVLSYASELSGQIGSKAAAAQDRKESADAVASEATTRRAAVEGVNLDEELVNLTTYQQAYNASARLIQAAKDIYDTLLNMVD